MNKVLIVSGTPIISGAEIVLGDYLNDHKNIRHFSILSSDLPVVKEFYQQFNVEKYYYSKYLVPVGAVNRRFLGVFKKIFYLFLAFGVFRKAFKDKDIKVVLGNNTGDVIYSIYTKLHKRKHINYVHDMVLPNTLIAKTIVFFDRFVDEYIAVSKAVKTALISIGIKESKIQVIYNGLKPSESYKKKSIDKEIHFGFVGNISFAKNPLDFIYFIERAKNKSLKGVYATMVFVNVLDSALFDFCKDYN
jgi:hypothetical protein